MMFNRDSKTNESKVPRGPTINDNDEQFDTAAMLLGQALLRFLERSNARIAEKVLEKLIPMVSQLTQIEVRQKQSAFHLDSIEKTLNDLSSHSKLLENASQTNLLLGKQHYEDHIIQQMTITRQQFNDWVQDLAEKTMTKTEQTVKEANLDFAKIDEVYAVGGGSMMPIVTELLEELTGKKVSRRCQPHCAAALGAVLAGRIEYKRQGKTYTCGDVALPGPGLYLREILSHSIGVLVLDQKDREICFEMLSKDTPVPSIQTKLFKLSGSGQTEVLIKLLQGNDGQDVKDCTALGHFELKDLPPRPDLIGRIEITFTLDANGILSAKARDVVSGKQSEMEVDYSNGISANQAAA